MVVDTEARQVQFDNYGGEWGKQEELDKLFQAYAVEKAHIEARKAGHSVSEQVLGDGSIKVTIQVGAVYMKSIEIVVSVKGETTVQTKGFTGASCQEASKFIEQALGNKTAEQKTPEFYQPQAESAVQRTQG